MTSHDVHHLYKGSGWLIAFCGHMPGQDEAGNWHTSEPATVLVARDDQGHSICCPTCLDQARSLIESTESGTTR